MKALSIKNPWAWLIVQGIKDIENRSWNTNFRGKFLVHAGVDRRAYDECQQFIYDRGMRIRLPDSLDLEYGGIIGEVELIDCVDSEGTTSPWFEGPRGFVLKNAKVLPFRPLKGKLGFFNVE